jgi:hypothetical protein
MAEITKESDAILGYDSNVPDCTIACSWTDDGRLICFTLRSQNRDAHPLTSRVAYDLALRLACASSGELLALEGRG